MAAAGNGEMARIHRELTEKIRIIRRLDFTQQARVDATYREHAAILQAILQRQSGAAQRCSASISPSARQRYEK